MSGAGAAETGGSVRPGPFYPSLQGLRGFSALSVLLLHIYLMAAHGGFFPNTLRPMEIAWGALGQGVPLFFMISGFVIPYSLVRHGDLRRFAVDRILRIFPLFMILHLVVFAIGPMVGYKWMSGVDLIEYLKIFFGNLFFLAPVLDLPLAQQNSWSLTYEFGFYLVLGFGWLAMRRWGWVWGAAILAVPG